MIDRPRPRAEVGDQRLVGHDLRSGAQLFLDKPRKRRLGRDVAQVLDRRQHLFDVVVGGKRVCRDHRMILGQRGSQPDMPPAGRAAVRQPDRHARPGVRVQDRPLSVARHQRRERLEVQLHVRPVHVRPGPEKAAAMIDRLGQRSPAADEVLQTGPKLAPPGPKLVIVGRHFHRPGVVDALMVAQVVADVRVVPDDRNAQPLQQPPRPDPRKLQKLRRVDRPPCQDHLGPRAQHPDRVALPVFDADRPTALDDHLRRERPGDHPQVRPFHGRTQEGPRRRVPPRIPDRHLVDPGTLLHGAIEIRVLRQAALAAGRDVGFHQRVQTRAVGRDEKRPTRAAPFIAARLVVLQRTVGRETFVPAPTGIVAAPILVIRPMPPDPDHSVDAGRPAQDLSPRPMVPRARQPRVGFGLVKPVHRGVVEQLSIAQRQLHIEPPV